MKKRLLTIIVIAITTFRAECMEEGNAHTPKTLHTHIFNILEYGFIAANSIRVVHVNDSDNILGHNRNTKEGEFSQYLSQMSPEDNLVIKIDEGTLTNTQIDLLNTSPARILVLIAANEASDLSRLELIIDQLNPCIKFALRDQSETGLKTVDIARVLTNPKIYNLFYLSLHHLNDSDAITLARHSNVLNLVSLSICRSNITKTGALALAQSTNFPCLEQYVIDRKALGDLTTAQFSDQIVFKDTLKRLIVLTYEPEFNQEIINF